MADVVKALVLAWSAALLTASYLGIFPQMNGTNQRSSPLCSAGAMASFGIERKKWWRRQMSRTIVDDKITKAGIN